MLTRFGPKEDSVYGVFGKFAIGESSSIIRAKYILTKIKPGNDGTPECKLASQMLPWREVFDVEELGFDELLQRDLDDSRVAHDLIPYLLRESGNKAKFFPPILAVIVPRRSVGSGIEEFYPARNESDELAEEYESVEEYGDLFDFKWLKWAGEPTPFAELSYNRQRSAFIIVDGQHRAMAVLALHRQLTNNWSDNAFESYYTHILVTPEQVESIELPVCIIYFPDLHEGNPAPREQGVDLSTVCREIFLVVNRSAKRVSESRELLLDDEDIAARILRRTLSVLKNRGKDQAELARIYSIAYEDSDMEDGQREVISGHLEYSSAIALHKIHRAISFGLEGAFKLDDYVDISDGRRTKNKNRPAEILVGTSVGSHGILERYSGKSLPPDEVEEVVKRLGDLADTALVGLFDKFRPFKIHNSQLRNLRMRLSDVHTRTQIEHKKASSLIFEGSGVRAVFESHFKRLTDEKNERYEGETVPDYIENQIKFCQSVQNTLDFHEQTFQHLRACDFFSINSDFFDSEDNLDDRKILSETTRKLFQTLATQAFQLGYVMAIFTVVEELKQGDFLYQERLELVQFLTEVYLAALNAYFSPKEARVHRTLTGYIREPRSSVFDASSLGLRGLLAMSVNELNERQWRFFRYAVLEIVHSGFCWEISQQKMKQMGNEWALEWYKGAIPKLADGIISEREKYVEDAVEAAVKGREFELLRMQTESEARGAGKSEEQIKQIVDELKVTRRKEAKENAHRHLKASLKIVEEKEGMVKRLSSRL